jgi:hypothetical protein
MSRVQLAGGRTVFRLTEAMGLPYIVSLRYCKGKPFFVNAQIQHGQDFPKVAWRLEIAATQGEVHLRGLRF